MKLGASLWDPQPKRQSCDWLDKNKDKVMLDVVFDAQVSSTMNSFQKDAL
jgi:hypothetical protein